MSKMQKRESNSAHRRWRSGVLVASCAVVALTAAACGGGGSNNASGGGTSGAPADCGTASTDPYPGVAAADAPSVTANDQDKLPDGKPGQGKPAIKIGSKDFAEQTLLGQLYGQALEAKGFSVSYQPKIGASEVIDRAFEANQLDMYPEYLGEIATSLANNPPQPDALTTFNSAKKYEQDQRQATIFKQTPFQDVDILLVKPDFCKQHNLKSAEDLKNVGTDGSDVVFTAQGASMTRYSGFKGLQEAYGLTKATFKGVPAGEATLQVINTGGANVADGFSTTTSVVEAVKNGTLTVLPDPKHIMGFQHVAPVVKNSVAQQAGPDFEKTLDWVSSKLSLDAINAMNEAVQVKQQPEKTVAAAFLQANGLK